jgi:hypothetical protein
MAECPRCRRPVAAARRQCLYCGAELEASAGDGRPPAAASPAPVVIPGSALPERVLVVVSLDGVEAKGLAAGLSLSPYEAAQWARRGGFHLHRAAPPAEADAERARLAGHGIPAFTIDERAVRAAAEPEPALGGGLEGQVLRVRTPAGATEVAAADLLLVVKGAIVREHAPSERLRFARTSSLEPGFRFHLHRHGQARPLEIDPAAFDFGAHRARESSLLEIAGWVAILASAAPVDDGFRRSTPALAPAAAAGGPVDALRSSGGRPPEILDNLAQFRFYSAWRGAVERQARPR